MSKQIIVLVCILGLTLSLFSDDSTVVKLTAKNFKNEVVNSDQFWLVEFYAPWCGHCKKSAPQYEKAAEILDGIIKVGAVNMDEERQAGAPYNVQGYPTIKFFGKDKSKPLAFESGERTFDKFVEYCLDQLKKEVKERQDNEATQL